MGKAEIPKKESSEVLFYFAWDHTGELQQVGEDQAISDGYRKYCRILLDGATLRYRLFVPMKAGKGTAQLLFRRLTQWIKDKYGMEVRNERGRLSNLNLDPAGNYTEAYHNKAKHVILPQRPGPRPRGASL